MYVNLFRVRKMFRIPVFAEFAKLVYEKFVLGCSFIKTSSLAGR